jgi:hypothetical protein
MSIFSSSTQIYKNNHYIRLIDICFCNIGEKSRENWDNYLEPVSHSGVDVMINIFCDFCQFLAKKWRFSQKPMLGSKFSEIFANFQRKNGIFLKNQCYDHNFCKN